MKDLNVSSRQSRNSMVLGQTTASLIRWCKDGGLPGRLRLVFEFRDHALQGVGAKLDRTYKTAQNFKVVSAPRDQIAVDHLERLSIVQNFIKKH